MQGGSRIEKGFTSSNTRARFQGCDIGLLDLDAMKYKIEPSKAFKPEWM